MAPAPSYDKGPRSSSGGGGGAGRGGDRDRGDRDADMGMGDDDKKGRSFGRRRVCRYCADKNLKVDFKDQPALKYFVTELGKIIPRRVSGNCAKHQRQVATAIKQSRGLALIPFIVTGN
jgi:small subunit ribosomal protein S18